MTRLLSIALALLILGAPAAFAQTRDERLARARSVLWQLRYDEARALFDEMLRANPNDADALEGRATAFYWSGDFRRAAREFRRVLAVQPNREFSQRSLSEILSTMRPSQWIAVDGVNDDQPLDALRAELAAQLFTDPLTRWTAAAGTYQLDSERYGSRDGRFIRIENETTLPEYRLVLAASLGAFEFPDGTTRPVGSASVRWRWLTLRVDHREELAAATALDTHATSTTTTLRWSRETNNLIAAAEASHRRYFDGNRGQAFVAYAVAPILKRNAWTLWTGASVAARDTDETRFALTATSSTLDDGFFRYRYRGEYDPYWTPQELREGRVVVALERTFARGRVKLHGDGGFARDRGVAFGPDAGPGPFPSPVFSFGFDRDHRPWRAGVNAAYQITSEFRIDISAERSTTVDYRSNTFHAAVVRRR